jgi:hypothetical protein
MVLQTEERERVEGAPATHGRERRPWRCGGGGAQMGLTLGENDGEGGCWGWSSKRWSGGRVLASGGGPPTVNFTGGAVAVGGASAFPLGIFQNGNGEERRRRKWRSGAVVKARALLRGPPGATWPASPAYDRHAAGTV